jgi:hypothetical protein
MLAPVDMRLTSFSAVLEERLVSLISKSQRWRREKEKKENPAGDLLADRPAIQFQSPLSFFDKSGCFNLMKRRHVVSSNGSHE